MDMKNLFYVSIIILLFGFLMHRCGNRYKLDDKAFHNEIKMSNIMQRDVTKAIQSAGFSCPMAKIAWAKGKSPKGDIVKIFCGPVDRPGCYQELTYQLTFASNDRIFVKPWK